MPNSRVTPARAHRLLRDGTAVPPDVREPDEFRAGHAPGAAHVPPTALADGTARVPSRPDLVLTCRSGSRSRRAAAPLAERGVAAAGVVGGMRDRAAQGLRVRNAHGAAGTVV